MSTKETRMAEDRLRAAVTEAGTWCSSGVRIEAIVREQVERDEAESDHA